MLRIDFNNYMALSSPRCIITNPMIVSHMSGQLILEWADISQDKEGDLPYLLSFVHNLVDTRRRAICVLPPRTLLR